MKRASTATDQFTLLKQITDSTPSVITVYDVTTGTYLYVSSAARKVLGYSPSLWLEKGLAFVASIVHPQDISAVLQLNKKALEQVNKYPKKDPVVQFEYRIKHANGSWRWFRTYGRVFQRDEKGKVRQVINISLDITELKDSERVLQEKDKLLQETNRMLEEKVKERTQRLLEREAQFKEAQRITNMGNWEFDLQTKKITWSDEVFSIHGVNPKNGEPSYEDFLRLFVHPKELIECVRLAITKGIPYAIDAEIRLPDGSIGYIQAVGRPVMKNGKCVKLYGAAIDITDRKRIEMNMAFLAEASKMLASSLDYRTTLQNVVRSAVPAFADWCLLDLLQDDHFERVLVLHRDPDKQKYAYALKTNYPPDVNAVGGIGKVLRTGLPVFNTTVTDKILLRTARNNPEIAELLKKLGIESDIIMPLVTNGVIQGGISFVSASKKRQYTTSDVILAEEIARRASLAIENAKLYREANEAVKIRDEFISIASHELKTPVTSMKVFAQLLERKLEKKEDKELLQYSKKINAQIDKQTKLIAELLDISRLQLGKMEFRKEKFSLEKCTRDIIEEVQLVSPHHAILLRGNASRKITGDADRIGQVITNLLTNATKYSPEAKKVIVKLSQNPKMTTLSVHDFGIGISQMHQARIFERFYRVNDTAERTYPGLGIGLYVSGEIIKRHNGMFAVKSEKGKGSTFSFSLPTK